MLKLASIFSTPQEAYIAKGMLDANGIPSIINNEDFYNVYPIGFNSIGGIRLMVPEEDYDKAIQLLKEHGDDAE